MPEESIKKSTSENLQSILEQLSADQMRFVIARQEVSTDKEAAKVIGVKPNTVYNWPDNVKRAVELLMADTVTAALHIRRRNLAKAMQIKAAGLDSDNERVRQGAASEIIEWELGRAKQSLEHTGAEGGPIETVIREVVVEVSKEGGDE